MDKLLHTNTFSAGIEGSSEPKPPEPEQLDDQRLEEEIAEVFTSRKFLTHVLSALTGIAIVHTSVHIMAKISLPAIATGTLGTIATALLWANALTKIKVDGDSPSIDSEFVAESLKATGGVGAMWIVSSEQRQINRQAQAGAKAFIKEVEQFEVAATISPVWLTPLSVLLVGLIASAAFAVVFKRGNDDKFF
jgi:ABC-type taurine transport system substrate-binding protein